MAFESIPVGMVVLDSKGRVQRANRALCQMLGYSETELMTISPYDITHPDDLAEGRERMAALARGDIPFYTRERHVTKDGRVVWGRLTTSVGRAIRRRTTSLYRHHRGHYRRRAAEQELARYRENLEELVRSRMRGAGSLAADVALGRTAGVTGHAGGRHRARDQQPCRYHPAGGRDGNGRARLSRFGIRDALPGRN